MFLIATFVTEVIFMFLKIPTQHSVKLRTEVLHSTIKQIQAWVGEVYNDTPFIDINIHSISPQTK
jgi:hypothetical protein